MINHRIVVQVDHRHERALLSSHHVYCLEQMDLDTAYLEALQLCLQEDEVKSLHRNDITIIIQGKDKGDDWRITFHDRDEA